MNPSRSRSSRSDLTLDVPQDSKEEAERKRLEEKKAKQIARKLTSDDLPDGADVMEYFDRPGGMALGDALEYKTPEQIEKERKEQAERSRAQAQSIQEEEAKKRAQDMARREKEREDREKAAKRAKEQARLDAIAAAAQAEEDARQRKIEEEKKKIANREKQRQREIEKKKEEARKEAEARARREKFEKEQEMMGEIKAVSAREENGEENDEEPPEDEEYRRELQKSMEEAAAMAAGAPMTEDTGYNWTPVQDAPPGPPGFEAPAPYTNGDPGNHGRVSAAQLSKLQAQVSSLQDQLTSVTMELSTEKRLREMEEQRLERIRQGMRNRENELNVFLSRWSKTLSQSSGGNSK